MAVPYEEHPSFQLPDDRGSTIWRYLTLAKLIDVLEAGRLFFCRADLLNDPLEGSLPAPNPLQRAIDLRAFMPDTEKGQETARQATEQMSRLHERMRGRIAMNCWREDEDESAAMWRLYTNEKEGVAIRSTIKHLCDSMVDAPQKIHVGRVSYIDYERDLIREDNMFNPFLHKRRSFDFEREVRAALALNMAFSDLDRVPAETGVTVPVDVPTLVSGIVVSPAAPDWFLRVVTSVVALTAPGVEVTRSSMSGPAIY